MRWSIVVLNNSFILLLEMTCSPVPVQFILSQKDCFPNRCIMASIKNGNKESPPQLDVGVVKVVVIGEPRCGKTRFIRGYYDRHIPEDIYSHNAVRVYPCEFQVDNQMRLVSIFEIPGDPDFFPEQRIPHYVEADILVFMYAIDDPSSLEMLKVKWVPEAIDVINRYKLPSVFVGTKKDLRDDQQVIERLALVNKTPVTFEQGRETLYQVVENGVLMECSANDLRQVEDAFETIFAIVLADE